MTSLRQKMIDRGALASQIVTVVGDDGEAFEVEVRALMAGERGTIITASLVQIGDGDDAEPEVDQGKLGPKLVIACTYDPETKERVFGAADEEVVACMSASFVDPIVKAAMRISGISAAAQKEAEKNSGATTVAASASPSPAS